MWCGGGRHPPCSSGARLLSSPRHSVVSIIDTKMWLTLTSVSSQNFGSFLKKCFLHVIYNGRYEEVFAAVVLCCMPGC